MKSEALKMDNITKVYPNGVVANYCITLSVKLGEIHALSGENGAGKSTLMKILFGEEKSTSGKIYIKGKEAIINNPSDALQYGIGMVHQHFMLVPSLSVLDNIILGIEPKKGFAIDNEKALKDVKEIMNKYNMFIDPLSKVQDLSVGQKQKLEILKILVRGAKILILDEPTAVLTPQETKDLFHELILLKQEGYTIIFISHKLKEVRQLCSRITIIKKGRYQGTYLMNDLSDSDISKLMIGRELISDIFKEKLNKRGFVLKVSKVVVKNSTGRVCIDNLNFNVSKGEILGIAGVEGNGQEEIVSILTGLKNIASGNIFFKDLPISNISVAKIRRIHISHIPEDRMSIGICPSLSVTENLIADKVNQKQFSNKFGILNKKFINKYAEQKIKDYEILCKNPNVEIKSLSGGNIQKVVVAREFENFPELLVVNQPTRGVDVGSSEYIRNKIINLRDSGCAIVLVSSDLTELLALADTIIVLVKGQIVALFNDVDEITEEELGKYMLGVSKMDKEDMRGYCRE